MDNDTNSTNGTFNGTTNGTTFEGWQPRAPRTWSEFWLGLIPPALYLFLLIGGLWSFSTLYRRRQQANAAKLEPWFPQHKQRDMYLSLLHLDPAEASGDGDSEKKLSKVPDSILKAALLQRALEDVRRIVILRTSKPALQTLLQRGSVGDQLWQRFLRAEKEMEEEIKDVVTEANAFQQGWGQVIFQSANEMNQNRMIRERVAEISAKLETEKAWWENKRAGIQSDFMKEIEAEAKPAEPRKTGSSDEDTVIVGAGGPAEAQGGASAKKKKGKK